MKTYRVYFEVNGYHWFRDVKAEHVAAAQAAVAATLPKGGFTFDRPPREK